MEEKHTAMCGLDRGSCVAFIATKNNDNGLRIKTAKEWTKRYKHQIKPADVNCLGCLSKTYPMYSNCLKCEIRKCGLTKEIKNCRKCKDYKCDKLTGLQKHFF